MVNTKREAVGALGKAILDASRVFVDELVGKGAEVPDVEIARCEAEITLLEGFVARRRKALEEMRDRAESWAKCETVHERFLATLCGKRTEQAEEAAASRPTGPVMGVSDAQADVERCAARVVRETNPPGGKTSEQFDAERAAMLGRWRCRGCSTELSMVAEPGMYDRPLDTPWSWAPLGQRWEHRCPGQGLFYVTDRIGRAEVAH